MTIEIREVELPRTISESNELYRTKIPIGHVKTCECKPNHLNCMTAKEWIKSQLGVWQFNYEKRDIRDKIYIPQLSHCIICDGKTKELPFTLRRLTFLVSLS